MRKATGTGYPRSPLYPHNNLNRDQRAALDRLHAPRFMFTRYWASVTLTDPDGRGVRFFYGKRRTWSFYVRGWRVFQVSGRVKPGPR